MKNFLHLFLIAQVFLYLYMPLIDHANGQESVSRPHVHIHFDSPAHIHFDEFATQISEQHEESVLCLLNLDAIMGVIPVMHHDSLASLAFLPHFVSKFIVSILPVSSFYFSALDPPPRL